MGELKKNVYLRGLSGQVNPELVYMQRAGKTFVPGSSRRSTKQPTPERLDQIDAGRKHARKAPKDPLQLQHNYRIMNHRSLPHHFINSYRLLFVFKTDFPDGIALKRIFYQLIGVFGYNDLARSRGALQT
jgi:hypothetical protein